MNGRRLALVAVVATVVMAGCAGKISFDNATPGTPQRIEGKLYKPDGAGPFPALVLLHGCQGVVRQTETWAHWLRARGYVALAVDSFGPRHDPADCKDGPIPRMATLLDELPVIMKPPMATFSPASTFKRVEMFKG